MPTSMLISPSLWRRWFKPLLERVIQAGRAVAAGIPIAYHTDGWCLPVIGDPDIPARQLGNVRVNRADQTF